MAVSKTTLADPYAKCRS